MSAAVVPDVEAAFATLAGLVLEDGRCWGEVAADWQVADAMAVLDRRPPAPRMHYLTRPRGGSKTTDLAAVGIAWLLEQSCPGEQGYVVASDEDQAADLLLALGGLARRTDGVGASLRVEKGRAVRPSTGAALNVLAADGPSAYGKRPALTIVDEFAQWPDTRNARSVWEAVTSAVPKVPGGRLVILTTAGDPAHFSFRVLDEARKAPADWRVQEVAGPLPWRTEDDLRKQRGLLPDWSYRRLHLNEWVAADDSLVDVDVLRRCCTFDGPLPFRTGVRYVLGVDLATRRDSTVVSVCHVESLAAGRRRVVLDRQLVWTPKRGEPVALEHVEQQVASLAVEYAGGVFGKHSVSAPVVFDPAEGRLMMDRLRTQGIAVTAFDFTTGSVGRLGSLLFQLLRDELLALPANDEALFDELSHVRLRETSLGQVRLDHDSGRHDDRAVSIALAAQHLLGPGSSPAAPLLVSGSTGRSRYDGDLSARQNTDFMNLLEVDF